MRVNPYKKAESIGIEIESLSRSEVIHAIQVQEGCSPCFGSHNQRCISFGCCWRYDCLEVIESVKPSFSFEVV